MFDAPPNVPKTPTIIEKHFYWMPESTEAFLAAVTAMQSYCQWLDIRVLELHADMYLPNSELEFLVPCCFEYPDKRMKTTWRICQPDEVSLRDYEHAIQYNAEIGYKMAEANGKHITQIFGIMTGSEPELSLPDLSLLGKIRIPPGDVLIGNFDGADRLVQFIEDNKGDVVVDRIPQCTPQELFTMCLNHKMVIDVRSAATYFAASLKWGVVEIYPPDVYREWLSKWSSPYYQMVNQDKPAADLIYRAFEAMWKKVQMKAVALGANPNAPKTTEAVA